MMVGRKGEKEEKKLHGNVTSCHDVLPDTRGYQRKPSKNKRPKTNEGFQNVYTTFCSLGLFICLLFFAQFSE